MDKRCDAFAYELFGLENTKKAFRRKSWMKKHQAITKSITHLSKVDQKWIYARVQNLLNP